MKLEFKYHLFEVKNNENSNKVLTNKQISFPLRFFTLMYFKILLKNKIILYEESYIYYKNNILCI